MNYIWTNHARSRLKERNIPESHALAAINRPTRSKRAATKGGWVFERIWSNGTVIKVVAKKNNKGEWVILSVWSKNTTAQPSILPALLVLIALLVLLVYAYVR